ncbi:MAG: tRNA adenosine(34) deaminase TadA [Cocleimonas sp.]
MAHALKLAKRSQDEGEVPVGAVLVKDDTLIAEGWNRPIESHDPTAHAEIMVLRAAGKVLSNYRLPETTLYVTLEPCTMCAGAMIHARIANLVYGASEHRTGVAGSVIDIFQQEFHYHKVAVTSGVMQAECSQLLKAFFKARR